MAEKSAFVVLIVLCSVLLLTSVVVPDNILSYTSLTAVLPNTPTIVTTSRVAPRLSRDDVGAGKRVPVLVIIVSYMRSGTSFLGKMFDENPDTLYVFEPLSYVCEFSVPNFKPLIYLNGSSRSPDLSCENIGQNIIRSFLSCNIRAIDKPTLTQAWMTRGKKTGKFYRCYTTSDPNMCVTNFIQTCNSSCSVVLKTIRTRLGTVLRLMKEFPNLKVIHLVRDPRAIIRSRQLMGEYYYRNLMKTGANICGDMARDTETYKKLNSTVLRRIYRVRYEDIAENPVEMARAMYTFLNLTLPENVVKWIKINTNAEADGGGKLGTSRANSYLTANNWRTSIPWSFTQNIEWTCNYVMRQFGYLPSVSENVLRNLSQPLRLENWG